MASQENDNLNVIDSSSSGTSRAESELSLAQAHSQPHDANASHSKTQSRFSTLSTNHLFKQQSSSQQSQQSQQHKQTSTAPRKYSAPNIPSKNGAVPVRPRTDSWSSTTSKSATTPSVTKFSLLPGPISLRSEDFHNEQSSHKSEESSSPERSGQSPQGDPSPRLGTASWGRKSPTVQHDVSSESAQENQQQQPKEEENHVAQKETAPAEESKSQLVEHESVPSWGAIDADEEMLFDEELEAMIKQEQEKGTSRPEPKPVVRHTESVPAVAPAAPRAKQETQPSDQPVVISNIPPRPRDNPWNRNVTALAAEAQPPVAKQEPAHDLSSRLAVHLEAAQQKKAPSSVEQQGGRSTILPAHILARPERKQHAPVAAKPAAVPVPAPTPAPQPVPEAPVEPKKSAAQLEKERIEKLAKQQEEMAKLAEQHRKRKQEEEEREERERKERARQKLLDLEKRLAEKQKEEEDLKAKEEEQRKQEQEAKRAAQAEAKKALAKATETESKPVQSPRQEAAPSSPKISAASKHPRSRGRMRYVEAEQEEPKRPEGAKPEQPARSAASDASARDLPSSTEKTEVASKPEQVQVSPAAAELPTLEKPTPISEPVRSAADRQERFVDETGLVSSTLQNLGIAFGSFVDEMPEHGDHETTQMEAHPSALADEGAAAPYQPPEFSAPFTTKPTHVVRPEQLFQSTPHMSPYAIYGYHVPAFPQPYGQFPYALPPIQHPYMIPEQQMQSMMHVEYQESGYGYGEAAEGADEEGFDEQIMQQPNVILPMVAQQASPYAPPESQHEEHIIGRVPVESSQETDKEEHQPEKPKDATIAVPKASPRKETQQGKSVDSTIVRGRGGFRGSRGGHRGGISAKNGDERASEPKQHSSHRGGRGGSRGGKKSVRYEVVE